MNKNRRPVSRDQSSHETAAGRGFVLWIALYLCLTLTFLIADHPGALHAYAGHHAAAPAISVAHNPNVPGSASLIARGC